MRTVRTDHVGGCCAICTAAIVPGWVFCWMGDCWEHVAEIVEREERKMEREAGSYIRTKSYTAAISLIFATDLNKRRLGAIRSKAHPASAPFTVLPHLPPLSHHNVQVSPPSVCSHTVAGIHQQCSWGSPLQLGTPGVRNKLPRREQGREQGKKICLLL